MAVVGLSLLVVSGETRPGRRILLAMSPPGRARRCSSLVCALYSGLLDGGAELLPRLLGQRLDVRLRGRLDAVDLARRKRSDYALWACQPDGSFDAGGIQVHSGVENCGEVVGARRDRLLAGASQRRVERVDEAVDVVHGWGYRARRGVTSQRRLVLAAAAEAAAAGEETRHEAGHNFFNPLQGVTWRWWRGTADQGGGNDRAVDESIG